ncbi:MAG: B12-binding domain-containing radical SAM protein, partial [bacterium]|nr:B12-binding domain-containing radical SAM protein [bacterium]
MTEPLVNQLEEYAAKEKITAASLLNCAWGLLLQKYNNSDDVLFGTTVSGRTANLKGIEEIAGLFINTIPLRVKIEPANNEKEYIETTIETMVHRIDQHLRKRQEYENTPLVNIKEYSSLDVKEELFDTLLVLENYPLDERLKQKEGAIQIDSFSMVETTHYDLTVGITMFEGIRLELDYNSTHFDKEKIRILTAHFTNILQDMITNPGKKIAEVTLMDEEEKSRILSRFNRPDRPYPKNQTLHQLLEEQAAKIPEKTALIAEGETAAGNGEIKLTYRQLNEASLYLARQLIKKGFQPG